MRVADFFAAPPSMTMTGVRFGSGWPVRLPERGTAESKRARVGMLGRGEDVATGACSTFSPFHITTTSSAISATTPMSWVMKMTAVPISCCRSRMMLRICAWIVTSSAVVGSSAISSFGLQASAMAIITRWRMPPESWCG